MLSPTLGRSTRPNAALLQSLITLIRTCARRRDIALPLTFFAIGFAPITSLAIAVFEWVPLPVTTRFFVLPAFAIGLVLSAWQPRYGALAATGYVFGIVAVLLYDGARVPWIVTGMWHDFIPNIGALLLSRTEGHQVLGYTWRWLGNGAGMGMAFLMVYPLVARYMEVRLAALVYGLAVWMCLLATLLLAPMGQVYLFKLTPFTFAISGLGHVIYGVVLGWLMHATRINTRSYAVDPFRREATDAVHEPVAA